MINNDRIVPIQKTDLLSMYNTILGVAGVSRTVIASDVDGNFTVTGVGDAGNLVANQPVQSLDFASGVTAAVVYFVADYDFQGFKVAGADVTASGADVEKDAVTLYKATLSGGAVTIAAI